MNDIDRAERTQAWKAFLIPSSLFVACLFNSAGIYILYTGSSVGLVFVGIGFAIIITGMFLFITFHNKQREQGRFHRLAEDMTPPLHQSVGQWGSIDADTTPVDPMPVYTPPATTSSRR
ncbi:MAG TPA: hypothetical protein V6D22_09350 [Candidatus Obscuribacterales bacterium]